jgi:hypothetical protein
LKEERFEGNGLDSKLRAYKTSANSAKIRNKEIVKMKVKVNKMENN